MFEQNDTTKLFLQQLEDLMNKGVIKKHSDLVDKLKWNKTSLSSVVNGRVNIPIYIYSNFKNIYGIKDSFTINSNNDEIYKEKYIALLESQTERFELIIKELKEIKQFLTEK